MKTNKLIVTAFVLFLGLIGNSQTPDNLLIDPSNKVKLDFKKFTGEKGEKTFYKSKIENQKNVSNQSQRSSSAAAGTTAGEFSVSLSGAATYFVPFSMPPGIKDIAPNIGLGFSSQELNGLAGWGWNITGLSTISRIPSTKFHDVEIDPVDFDLKDRYALDGQRLMQKSGTYGSANSEYQTENYSNIKIRAYGTSSFGASYGPSYFIVFYPDGTLAYYGSAGNSRGRLEWALYKRVDPQGNYIQYDYLQSNNLLRIDRIRYGTNGSNTNFPNEVNFYYKNRTRPEISYINGLTFKRNEIIDRIEIKGGGQQYRKYILSYNSTSLGYEKLTDITESNELNESFPSINFTYDSSTDGFTGLLSPNMIFPGANYDTTSLRAGDVDADGKMDLILFDKIARNKVHILSRLFEQNQTIGYTVNTEQFDDVFSSNILSWNNKLLPQQGVTTITTTLNSNNSTVRFRTFAMAAYGPVFQYDKNWSAPTYQYQNSLTNFIRKKIPFKYVSGDFNGDGLTDVLALGESYTNNYCYEVECSGRDADSNNQLPITQQSNESDQNFNLRKTSNLSTINENSRPYPPDDPDPACYACGSYTEQNRGFYFIDLNRNLTSGFVSSNGSLQQSVDATDRIVGADFNGDGKTDLIHFKTGVVYVYELNQNNNLSLITSFTSTYINLTRPILLGDYNGDGKIDFVIPQANGSQNWQFFMSRGSDIYSNVKNVGFIYQESYAYNGAGAAFGVSMDNPIHEYHYISQDINGDGKSDIIKHQVHTPAASNTVVVENIQTYSNYLNDTNGLPTFQLISNETHYNNGVKKFGIPLFLEARQSNGNLEYAYISGNDVYSYEFGRDNKKDMTLQKITNDEIVTDIYYENLDSKYGTPNYSFNYDENYPFVNINVAPGFKIVKEAKNTASGHEQRQLFLYSGAVANIEGLGFLGFKTLRKSNWFGTNVGQLWNLSEHDMQMRGAVTKQWVSTSASIPPYSYANKTTYIYNTILLPNKVFINLPEVISKLDGLQNTGTSETYSYDLFYNPLNISSSNPAVSNSVTYEYTNNASALNNTYHIGRPTKKVEQSNINNNSFSTEVQFTYNNNLASQVKKKGNGTPWLTEDFLYDVFGNLERKTLSGTGISNRVENFEYDTSGRFLTKSIDIEGLETTYTYTTSNGNPFTTTNPYGLSTSFLYDGWNRLVKETNYLGKQTLYEYNKENVSGIGWCFTKSTNYPEGRDEKIYLNAFGWLVQSKILSLNNQWIQKKFEYDAIGRKFRESEPFFSSASPTQWNQITLDSYGRPISNQLFNGRVITTTYNGLTVTVDDGVKTVTTIKDAGGNISSVQDPGGTVEYEYFGNGTMKSAIYGTHIVNVSIDGWGRKIALNDPSVGNYTYAYNILGELTKETTPKGSTDYVYDNFGKLFTKGTTGDNTKINSTYTYNPTSKLLTSISSTDVLNQKNYTYNYTYDTTYKKLTEQTEVTDVANFSKKYTYDLFGRVENETYKSTSLTSGIASLVKTKNVYDTSGILKEIRNYTTNSIIWKIGTENARGQVLSTTLGNGITKTREYDNYGFLTNIYDRKLTPVPIGSPPADPIVALKTDYSFDAQRGNLTSRKNYAFTNWNESFTYDSQDRLTQISGAVSQSQSYDPEGRITSNSSVGNYDYQSTNKYRLESIDLNDDGENYYEQHQLQQIDYNAFKKPVSIHEEGHGRVNFLYGPMMNRTCAYYGGEDTNINNRQYHKYYSSIMPVEIIEDLTNSTTKIITYVGGDAYTAPIVHIKTNGLGTDLNDYHYLHRDYLGSILAISNSSLQMVEEAQFGAWGVEDKFKSLGVLTTFGHDSLLGRGFTGHEHFFEVGLIHMNGRMYDSKLGRFLSPDNNIQNPYNTQNFNRYGYVWNNPLSFNDPSGEFVIIPILVGVLIGAAIAAASYAIPALITGNWSWSDFGKSVLIGAIAGGLGAGLSVAANSLSSSAILNGGTGAFWQSATFNVLSEVASQVGTGLVFGDSLTLGTFIGAAAGAYIGAQMGAWSGIKGGYLKNAFGEITYGAFKGGIRGAASGGFAAVIDGKSIKDGILNGARNGAIGGASQSVALIATFGATYLPSENQLSEVNKMAKAFNMSSRDAVWRKGGLYQILQPLWSQGDKREVTWGNTIATFSDTTPDTFGHEFGHIIQFQQQGWANFQGKGFFEQLFFNGNPYSTPGANEYEAEWLRLNYGN